MYDLDYLLHIAHKASKKGAFQLKKFFGKIEKIEFKSSNVDLVTEADRASESAIVSEITSHFPHHSFLCEESGLSEPFSSDFLWIIDPLDGTTNYTHSYPMVAISIGLLYKKKIILGIVYNPFSEECFWAVNGFGAFLNNVRLSVSLTKNLERCLLATGFAYDRRKSPENNYRAFTFFTQLTQGVRRSGSAALDLAYVASGRLDGYWEKGLRPWDLAAGALLVAEAGGTVSGFRGEKLDLFSGKILSTNKYIHKEVKGLLLHLDTKKG